ncbi:MAG: ATP-dependent Clp protease ATP-binding subunit [Proteobacteria bacterium]|nr:ATP-dependent Clp protease ATP-binding subunit [Pseudomonadota bacterium]
MASKSRPKDLPYQPQNAGGLVVYGLRMLFQLWPLWVMYGIGTGVEKYWVALALGTPAGISNVLVWFAPFIHIGFAVALLAFAYSLKKMNLASWATVDAAAAGLILTMVLTTWDKFKHLPIPETGFDWHWLAHPNYGQLLALVVFTLFLISLSFRGSVNQWFSDLAETDGDSGPDTASPTISGTVTPPPSPQLRDIDPEKFASALQRRVIGQDVIANQLAKSVSRRMAQQRRGKPVFTGLFAGPTGVGKTEMAKAVASALLGSEKTLFRVDCGNVLGEAGLQTLIGAPTGYMGSDKPGALTAHVQRFPNAVILFDEIEKAMGREGQQSPLFRLLLSMLDEGRFTEQSTGQAIDATGCVILMTSNAAHKALGAIYEQHKADPTALTRATKDELQSYFAPEFLARIDLVTSFSPLDTNARAKVLAQHIARIAKQYEMSVGKIDAGFINQGLVQWQALESYGAREVLRWLEDAISDPVISAKKSGIKTVDLVWKNDAVQALPASKN